MIYLDTNVTLWLAGAKQELSPTAVETINAADVLFLSPMVELELEYLHEVGRIRANAQTVLDHLRRTLHLRHCERSFAAVVTTARAMKWTRDPFDRLITAQAAMGEDTLLTRDKTIRANYPKAVW